MDNFDDILSLSSLGDNSNVSSSRGRSGGGRFREELAAGLPAWLAAWLVVLASKVLCLPFIHRPWRCFSRIT